MPAFISEVFDTYGSRHAMNEWVNEQMGLGYEPFSIVKVGGTDDVLVSMVNPTLVRKLQREADRTATEQRWRKLDATHIQPMSHEQDVEPALNGGD